jgi:hypothetical protein
VAQLVEHHLAKVRVASSNLVVRSKWGIFLPPRSWWSGREARQRPAKPSTRVQIPSPPPRTISSAGERFPDTEEVTGSIPVSSTGSARIPRAISSAGERFPDTEEVTGSIPVSRTRFSGIVRRCSVRRTRHRGKSPARLAQRESASLTRKRSLVQSQYRAQSKPPVVSTTGGFSVRCQDEKSMCAKLL